MGLFLEKEFTGHAGGRLNFKIECDALTADDYSTLAGLIKGKIIFSEVIGVPAGGVPLANALRPHCSPKGPLLIVDDVLTTGFSMEEARQEASVHSEEIVGLVIFARGKCPNWIKPIFQLAEWAQS